MHPDTTLKCALDAFCNTPGPAVTAGDLETAREALKDLADWLDAWGFSPRWPVDGPTIEDVIAATADSARLVAQVTRVCWAIDAIDRDADASRRRVLHAVNALHFTCANVAETITRAEEIAAERAREMEREAR